MRVKTDPLLRDWFIDFQVREMENSDRKVSSDVLEVLLGIVHGRLIALE
jgi:hypothetical protein